MNDLIERLVAEANLTQEQAQKAVAVIANYIKEQVPMFSGAVDNLLKKK